jgi:hypothetical protein
MLQSASQSVNLLPESLRRAIDCGLDPFPVCAPVLLHTATPPIACCPWTWKSHVDEKTGRCKNPGKTPLGHWGVESLSRRATADDCRRWLEEWEARGAESINWGFHLGKSEIAGIDVDPRNGGLESWAALVEKYGAPPLTWRDSVRTRGFHLWFRAPAGGILPAVTKIDLAPGVEFKHGSFPDGKIANTYFAGPPSMHKCGKPYDWDAAPWDMPAAGAPQWMIDLAHELQAKKTPAEIAAAEPSTRKWAPTPDNTDLLLKRARNYVQTIPGAVAGQKGHDQTFHVACVLVRDFALPISDAYSIFREWNWTCSPPWSDAELQRKLSEADKAPGQRGKLRDAAGSAGEWAAEFASVINLRIEEVPLPARGATLSVTPAAMLATERLLDLAAFAPIFEPIPVYEQADEIYRRDRDYFHCPNGTAPGLEALADWMPFELEKRCGRRDCIACCRWRDWRALYVLTNRISAAISAGRAIFTFDSTPEKWDDDRHQISYWNAKKPEDGYCRFEWRGGYRIFSTSLVGEEISKEAAIAQIKDCLAELTPRRHVPDYTASDSWEIPKKEKREEKKFRFRTMLEPISEEEKERIADNCGCEIKTSAMPDGDLHETVSTTSYRRGVWSPDDRKYFWEQRKIGVAFPREEMERLAWERDTDDIPYVFDEDDIDRPVMEIDLNRLNC